MVSDQNLREHLLWLLEGGAAHVHVENVINNFPAEFIGVKPPDFPHTAWQILEHMRIFQWDILEFCLKADHISPKFPQGYWPRTNTPRDAAQWDTTIAGFRNDLAALIGMAKNPNIDLFSPIPHGSGQTYLREILLVADHNSYHLGQLVTLRRMLNIWE